jgi:hypothetical protein
MSGKQPPDQLVVHLSGQQPRRAARCAADGPCCAGGGRRTRDNARVSTDQTERVGVEAVRYLFAELGWFPKEAVRPDYGVDLFVETSNEHGRPSGRLLGVQVKSGSSYVSAAGGGTLYVGQRHVDYWTGFAILVIVVVYDPGARVAYWQVISPQTLETTPGGWKIDVPPEQTLDVGARGRLASLAAAG